MKSTMKICAVFLGALAAYGQTVSLSDTLTNAVGGGSFTGRVTVTLNAPGNASPLYYSTTSLTGWQAVYCIGVTGTDCTTTTSAGAFAATLYANSTITPAGTSYAARFQPTKGAAWSETWTVEASDTKLYQVRSTTVPSPTVTFQPSQLALAAGSVLYGSSAGVGTALSPGTNGHILTLSGGYPTWAAAGGVTSITGTANQITASASTGAVTLSLPATITGLTSVTSTGFTGALTGNASTATALAANPAACTAGQYVSDIAANGDLTCAQVAYSQLSGTSNVVTGAASLTTVGAIPYVTSAGVLGQDATALFWDATNDRLGVGTTAPAERLQISDPSHTVAFIVGDTTLTTTNGLNGYRIAPFADGNVYIDAKTASGGYVRYRHGQGTQLGSHASWMQVDTSTGNVMVGTGTTNGNYKLDVNSSSTTGTFRVFDQTATNGSTLAVIQAGQGQSGNLLELRNNAGTAKLVWDATNERLGVGTNAPGQTVDFRSSGSGAGVLRIQSNSTGGYSALDAYDSSSVLQASFGYGNSAAGAFASQVFLGSRSNVPLLFLINTTERARFAATTGNLLIGGGTTDGGYRGDINTSGTTGTLRVFDQGGAGSTLAVIQAGAGQSGNLTNWQSNAGVVVLAAGSTGRMFGPRFTSLIDNGWALQDDFDATDNLLLASGRGMAWSSTTSFAGSKDIGLRRAAAGYLKVTDGSSGLGKIVVSQSTPAASTDACTAGGFWADATYAYFCTASGTIKRVTLVAF